jgi:AraC-like DNA-binding protein
MIDPLSRPLSAFPLFESRDFDDVRQKVSRIYCAHTLTPVNKKNSQLNAWQNALQLSKLTVSSLSYGSDVEIRPCQLERFYLLMLPYGGSAQIISRTTEVTGHAKRATIINPLDEVRMHWRWDCEKLMVKIDRAALEQQLAHLLGRTPRTPIAFRVDMPLEGHGARWWEFVRLLVRELECGRHGGANSATLAQLEDLLLTSLLEGQPNNHSEQLRTRDYRVAPRHVRLVERFIHEHAEQVVRIEELVSVSGVSARALFDGFRRFRSTTPMAYLRTIRLQRAREELLNADDGATVSSIASRWCFLELGRFADYYRKMYGETPSQTLRRRRCELII